MTYLARPQWALVLGGAACVWADVAAWETLYGAPWDGLVIAANDIGAHWPRELHHWVSLHPNKFKKWEALRNPIVQRLPFGSHYWVTWGKEQNLAGGPITDKVLVPWPGGSSGMFAVQVAKEVGCTRVVLCGAPMTTTPHFKQTQESFAPQWKQANAHWRVWPRQAHRMLGWVRSMSGRTQESLGAPTLEWLLAR